MSDSILHIKTIGQLHDLLGYDKPKHPLITVIDVEKLEVPAEMMQQRMTGDLYIIMMKDGDCGLQYGRNHYDFEEGVLTFIAPNQVVASDGPVSATGWMLFFHPDLIRRSNLGTTIDDYTFFSYEVHEALHLSAKEQDILNDCVKKIEFECDQNIDGHSQTLLVSNLELLLNYCNRFYGRQFHTRTNHHKDVVSQVEGLLKEYYTSGKQLETGAPNVKFFADHVHLSPNYLSDLLKKETGKNMKEHINDFVVDKAKTILLNSSNQVSEIAYDLGFNYPHYFSRLFKKKTGMTPQEYREVHFN